MAESRWLSRMPVYDIVKGRVVGRVHRLIVVPDARKVIGLLLATRLGREPRCLPFRHVHAVGEHAVTVRGTEAIAPVSELPDMEEAMRAQRRIHNSPILTEGGAFIGDADEFTINTQSGRLESLLVSGGLIRDLFRGQAALPSHLIVAIGEDATIVKDIAVSFLEQRRLEQGQGRAARTDSSSESVRPRTVVGGGHAPPGRAESVEHENGASLSWGERLRQALNFRGGVRERLQARKEPVTEPTREERPIATPDASAGDRPKIRMAVYRAESEDTQKARRDLDDPESELDGPGAAHDGPVTANDGAETGLEPTGRTQTEATARPQAVVETSPLEAESTKPHEAQSSRKDSSEGSQEGAQP